MIGELAAKQVGLLHELVPGATLITYLVNPSNPITERNVRDAVDAAQKLGEKIEIVHASSEAEIDAAFDTMRGMRASALLVQLDAFLVNKRIVALAARDARAGHCGWVDELRIKSCRHVPPDGRLCRQGSRRRKPGRVAGVAAHQIRDGDQSENRQGAWIETL
jgi:hypothetical protein